MEVENLANPLEILGETEVSLVSEADQLIRSGVPSKDSSGQITVYISHNIRLQNDLLSLRSGVRYTLNKVLSDLREREALVRTQLMDEGFRSNDERSSMLYRDSKWRDLNARYTALLTIEDRVNGLEWILKSALSSIN